MLFIAPIVEGHGEVEAVPRILHRIASHAGKGGMIKVNPPIRIKATLFFRDASYFEKYVLAAATKAAFNNGVVLLLLDSEDFCPAEKGPELLGRAIGVRPDIRYIVALAYREFETWFITSFSSLRDNLPFREGATAPTDPESLRDAKGWLSRNLVGYNYDPISHQSLFCNYVDIQSARESHSFARLYEKINSAIE